MTQEQATFRYLKVFLPATIVYAIGSQVTRWAADNIPLSTPVLYALASIPVLAIICAFWAQWRFVTNLDEFLRLIQIKAILFGVACVMIIASGWGTFELLADAPKLQVFWLMPMFFISYAAAAIIISKKEHTF